MINGVSVPRIVMRKGEVQNWRLLNAGIFNLLNLSLDGHTLYVHGIDGNPMADYKPSPPLPVPPPGATTYPTGVVLAPGNRASVLVQGAGAGNLLPAHDAGPDGRRQQRAAGLRPGRNCRGRITASRWSCRSRRCR